jgi:hypothetical protein
MGRGSLATNLIHGGLPCRRLQGRARSHKRRADENPVRAREMHTQASLAADLLVGLGHVDRQRHQTAIAPFLALGQICAW